jgi:hypothetical protein
MLDLTLSSKIPVSMAKLVDQASWPAIYILTVQTIKHLFTVYRGS